MPRKAEIQAEEAVVNSPLRRSSRINVAANPTALSSTSTKNTQSSTEAPETKAPKTRRASLSQENAEKDDKKENKPAPRGRRGSTAKEDSEPKPEPAKTRSRRSSATTEPPTKTEEPKPITKRRRSSATEELPERETVRPLRGRRSSTTDKPEEDTENKNKGKKSIIKEETVKEEPVRKSVRSRRNSATDKTEENAEVEIDKEKKRPTTRGRRASTDKAENEPETKTLRLTPSKSKRRLSVTENVVGLEPIEEQELETKGRKSNSPITELRVVLNASPATSETSDENKQPSRETRSTRSTPVKSRRRLSVTENVNLEPIEEQELETKGRKSNSPKNMKVLNSSPTKNESSTELTPVKSRRRLSITETADRIEPITEELQMNHRKSKSPTHQELKVVLTPSPPRSGILQVDKKPETDKHVTEDNKDSVHEENQSEGDISREDFVEKVVLSLTPSKKSRPAEVKTNLNLSIIEEKSFAEEQEHLESRADKDSPTIPGNSKNLPNQSPVSKKIEETSPETLKKSFEVVAKDNVENSMIVEENKKTGPLNPYESNHTESTNQEIKKEIPTVEHVKTAKPTDSSVKGGNIDTAEVNDASPTTKIDFPDISAGSDGSFRFHLNISLPSSNSHNISQNESVEVDDVNTSKTSNSSDKENIDMNNSVNPTMELQSKEKLTAAPDITSIANVNENEVQNVVVNRISNVFRPKMKENSFVEPMDVDEFPSILSTTENKFPFELDESNVEIVPPAKSTPIATRSIKEFEKETSVDSNTHTNKMLRKESLEIEEESMDESFKLSLSITQQELTYVAEIKNEITVDYECIEASKIDKTTLVETEKAGEKSMLNEDLLKPKEETSIIVVQATEKYPINDFEPVGIDGTQKGIVEQVIIQSPQHIFLEEKLEEVGDDLDTLKTIVTETEDGIGKDTNQIHELNSDKEAVFADTTINSGSDSNPEKESPLKMSKSPAKELQLESGQTEHLSKSPLSVSCQLDLDKNRRISTEKEISREGSSDSDDRISASVEEMKPHSPEPALNSLELDGYKEVSLESFAQDPSETNKTKISQKLPQNIDVELEDLQNSGHELEHTTQHLPEDISESVDKETDADNMQLETNPIMSPTQQDSDFLDEGQSELTELTKMDVSDEYEFDVPSDEEIEKTRELKFGEDESHLEHEVVNASPSKGENGNITPTDCKKTNISLGVLEDIQSDVVEENESSASECKKYSKGENMEETIDEHKSKDDLMEDSSHTVEEGLQQIEANGVYITAEPEDSSTVNNYKNLSEKISLEEEIVSHDKTSECEDTYVVSGYDQTVHVEIEKENTGDKEILKDSIKSATSNSVTSETESVKDAKTELENMENDFKDVVQDHKEPKTSKGKLKSKKSKKTEVICEKTPMDYVQKEMDGNPNDDLDSPRIRDVLTDSRKMSDDVFIEESTNIDSTETKGDTETKTANKLKSPKAQLIEESNEVSLDFHKSETDVSFKGKTTKKSKKKKITAEEDQSSFSDYGVEEVEYSTTRDSEMVKVSKFEKTGGASSSLIIQINHSERDAVEVTSDEIKTSGKGKNKKGKRKSESFEASIDMNETEKDVLESPKKKRKSKIEILEENETNKTQAEETHIENSPVTVDDDSDEAMIEWDTSDKMKTSGKGKSKNGKKKSESIEASIDTNEVEKDILESPKKKRKSKNKIEVSEENETNKTQSEETPIEKSLVTEDNNKETDDDDDAMIEWATSDKTKTSGKGKSKNGKKKSESFEASDTNEVEKDILESPKKKRKSKNKIEIPEENETRSEEINIKKSEVTEDTNKEPDDSDDAMICEIETKSTLESNSKSDVSLTKSKINLGGLENFAMSKLDEYLFKKISEMDSAQESSDSSEAQYEESEKEENEFLSTMAEEGEEDTPSEGSNDIIDEGESINTTESEMDSDDDYDENDSFISNGEECELLSGDEYDLDIEKSGKKKSRIIELDDCDDEVIKIKRKEKPVVKKKSRIITISDSSDSENETNIYQELRECNEDSEPNVNVDPTPQSPEQSMIPEGKSNVEVQDDDVVILEEPWPAKSPPKPDMSETCTSMPTTSISEDDQPQKNKRKSSITIHENINVSEIKDAALSERISNLVDTFCTSMRKGEISMNLSLEYAAKDSEEGSQDSPEANEEVELKKKTDKTPKKQRKSSSLSDDIFESGEKTGQIETKRSKKKRRRHKSAHKKNIQAEGSSSVGYSSEEGTSSKRADRLSVTLDNTEDSDNSSKKSMKKRRLSKSLENLNDGLSKKKKKANKGWKKELVSKEINISPRRAKKKIKKRTSSEDDLRTQTFGYMNQLITDVKKRPTRTIFPSRGATDMNNSWTTEIADVRPSTTIVSRRERTEYKLLNRIHPKDFRSQMLYDSTRVSRVDTKTLLKKRRAYF